MSRHHDDAVLTDLTDRLDRLTRSVRRMKMAFLAMLLFAGVVFAVGFGPDQEGVVDEVRARRLVIVDDAETRRVVIEQEAEHAQRRDRAAGIVLFDRHGTERGGMVTFDDGSAVIALDAPAGVGAPMRDRLALQVGPDGSASIAVLDNRTAIPVRLVSDRDGGGGLELLEYDLEQRTCTVRRLDGAGESTRELDLGGG